LIRITQDSSNLVVVTLTEKGSASHYLFQFKDLADNTFSYCVSDDTSPYQQRYNAFTITDTPNPTPTDAEVDLDKGQYKYFIYANSSASNLDPDGLTLLESGMCVVTGTETEPTEYERTQTYVEYEG
jgi:hypothetical protein